LRVIKEGIKAIVFLIGKLLDFLEKCGKLLLKYITFYGNIILAVMFFMYLTDGLWLYSLCSLAGILTFVKVNSLL
jgi:hypothetical protein